MYALWHAIKAHCMLALLSHLGLYVSLGLWAGVEAMQLGLWFAPGGAGSSRFPPQQTARTRWCPSLAAPYTPVHPPCCLHGAAAPEGQLSSALTIPVTISSMLVTKHSTNFPCLLLSLPHVSWDKSINTSAGVRHSNNSSLFSQSTKEWGQKVSDCPSAACRAGRAPHLLTSLFPEGISHLGCWLRQMNRTRRCWAVMIPVRTALCKVAFKIPFIRAQHYEEREGSVDNLASFLLLEPQVPNRSLIRVQHTGQTPSAEGLRRFC